MAFGNPSVLRYTVLHFPATSVLPWSTQFLSRRALIDGASELRTYYKIMLPQAKAALATVAIFQFVATWTDFILPLIYLNNSQDYTLSIGLYNSLTSMASTGAMAACIYFTLPTVFVFMIAQRYFVSGIATRGVR